MFTFSVTREKAFVLDWLYS